ncbi:alpha-mannosidase [Dulcicalothrix desertica PCC 7102]|uniref:Alpha-mannosidase n=1 Tax=Dulcicalothrix desertica PCC 7102 TaxID=232991 RepID=A0A3S1C1W8_9CYAN|nr:alpha-mannosidase [Dulcicalothrix desertica]RUS95548.1 alpha-mannosidase [Dulcicalothrix desertica PCC 7102]TWH54060.1 alpha-mannosidase [Dulcicalothrix desertica PCC 7102]
MTPQNPAIDTKSIITAIDNLRALCQTEVQAAWRYSLLDLTANQVFQEDISKWDGASTNDKGHIAWESGRRILWLAQKITVPECLVPSYSLQGKSLRLALVWWAEDVQVYVNGKLVAAGDLFDFSPRILLSEAVTGGDDFIVALRLVSPLHDSGALMRSHLVFESGTADDPGFVASEIAVVKQYLETFAPDRLSVLAEAVNEFYHGDTLDTERGYLKVSGDFKSKTIYLLGHAHLDMAWLWQVEETWRAAQNTFESVLKLQQDFADLVFCHSTPALYAWVEENRPDLFAQIQSQVKAGKWEVLGGFWVEPDLNLISGESIVRQLLYGQRYTQEKFGKISPIVWVPDTFGFCWTLPQFMVSAGIEYFVTQKLRWNDTTKFQKGAFLWRSPDGSEIFSYMSGLIGEGIDPEKMAAYSCEWETQTGIKDALWLPGVGDHGGGPTRDMLEIAQRWQKSQVFPNLEFTTAENYLRHINSALSTQHSALSTWNDELYLEFHRGCYTTHADQKRFNRKCEILLYEAEIFAAWANIHCGVKYPKAELETAWKKLLFNQFHDILPGSSITEVYTDALPEWQEVERVGTEILHKSLHEIALQAPLPTPPHKDAKPIFVFNSLNWSRTEVVCVDLPESFSFACVYSSDGIIPSQSNSSKLLFLAENIPSLGYSIFWLCPSTSKNTITSEPQTFSLENEYLRVVVNENSGDLDSIYDLVNQKEILNGAGNQLQSWKDSGQYWDGWNIDPNYAQHPLPATQLKFVEWLDKGIIQSRLRVVRTLGNSEFCQDYILDKGSRYLKIATQVNWQERHVLVKAAFSISIESDFATYEIPCGAIQRTTKPQTPEEKAKWEVPALKWADLTTSNSYGVSLLNDCKYGYDATPNQLRLTLLRGSEWPDSEADKGMHEFTYAVYPHAGSWEEAQTVQKGYELNAPLQVIIRDDVTSDLTSTQDSLSFLNLESENLILMAFKQAEDSDAWILRCYECNGKETQIQLHSDLGVILEEAPVDLLERPLHNTESSIKPWKINTYKVRFSK